MCMYVFTCYVQKSEHADWIYYLFLFKDDDIRTTQDLALRMSPSQEPSLHVAEADASAGWTILFIK